MGSHGGSRAGGSGGGSGNSTAQETPKMIKPLEGLRENDKQFRAALQEAKEQKAAVLEFENIMGKTDKRWWNGATWTDRKPSDATLGGTGKYKRTGTYKKKFKAPKSWGKNYDFG